MYNITKTVLIVTTTLLIVLGLSMLYSTSYYIWDEQLLLRQLMWVTLGTVCAVALTFFHYQQISRHSYLLLIAVSLPLAYLALANWLHHLDGPYAAVAGHLPFVGGLSKGSARWIKIWKLSGQPSEFAKSGIIVFMGPSYSPNVRHLPLFWQGFPQPCGIVGLVILLILLGGDLSTAAITGSVVACILFIAGVRLRFLALATVLAGAVLTGAIYTNPERISRITSYRNPEKVQRSSGYQLWHSQLALGSGGTIGRGFTESRMKHRYLPEAHTDFIVAIIGEELGFIGVLLLLMLYMTLMGCAFWIGCVADTLEGTLICAGIGLSLGLHAFLNISVVSGFCPTTGISVPFISYGGSNMLASLIEVGLLYSVIVQKEKAFLANVEDVPLQASSDPVSANRLHQRAQA